MIRFLFLITFFPFFFFLVHLWRNPTFLKPPEKTTFAKHEKLTLATHPKITLATKFIPFQKISYLNNVPLLFNRTLQMYTLNSKPILWSFWDFGPMSAYIFLGLNTLECHNPELTVAVLNVSSSKKLLTQLPEALDFLLPAHYADYVRGRVLQEFGGIWVDADTIGLGPLWSLFDQIAQNQSDMIGYSWDPDKTPIGVAAIGPVRAAVPPFSQWRDQAESLLQKQIEPLKRFAAAKRDKWRLYPIKWNGLMGAILGPILKEILARKSPGFRYKPLRGEETWGQLDVHFQGVTFLEKHQHHPSLKQVHYTELLILYNHVMPENAKTLDLLTFVQSDSFLSATLDASLRLCCAVSLEKELNSVKFNYRLFAKDQMFANSSKFCEATRPGRKIWNKTAPFGTLEDLLFDKSL